MNMNIDFDIDRDALFAQEEAKREAWHAIHWASMPALGEDNRSPDTSHIDFAEDDSDGYSYEEHEAIFERMRAEHEACRVADESDPELIAAALDLTLAEMHVEYLNGMAEELAAYLFAQDEEERIRIEERAREAEYMSWPAICARASKERKVILFARDEEERIRIEEWMAREG